MLTISLIIFGLRKILELFKLKFLLQELEERERNHYATQGRNEIIIQGLQRDVKYHEEKAREYEQKIRQLEHNITEEIQLKERARLNLQVILLFILTSFFFISIIKLYIYLGLCTKIGTCFEHRILRQYSP